MKTRDHGMIFMQKGFEQGTKHILSQLHEENLDLKRTLAEQAEMINRMLDIIQSFQGIAENMKERFDAKFNEDEDGLDTPTQLIGQ